MGIRTIGDLAHADRPCIVAALGKLGGQLHDAANGIDPSPVRLFTDKREVKSVGNGMTFREDLSTRDAVHNGLLYLTEPLAARLRAHDLLCEAIQVTVKFPSLQTVSHQRKLPRPTAVTSELYQSALSVLHDCWSEGTPLRSITVTACRVTAEDTPEQLDLFDTDASPRHEKRKTLDTTVDGLRDRFGGGAVKRCAVLHQSGGPVPEKEK
jgi:DNA polymerase-4